MKKKEKKKDQGGRSARGAGRRRNARWRRPASAVTRAGQKLDDRLAPLERVADGMEHAAVERFQSAAVAELRDDQLLRDLADLQAAFAAQPAGRASRRTSSPSAICRKPCCAGCRTASASPRTSRPAARCRCRARSSTGFAIAGDRGEAPAGLLVRIKVARPRLEARRRSRGAAPRGAGPLD